MNATDFQRLDRNVLCRSLLLVVERVVKDALPQRDRVESRRIDELRRTGRVELRAAQVGCGRLASHQRGVLSERLLYSLFILT